LLLLLAVPGARAEDLKSSAWVHRAWQTENGLPDNGVSGVTQTPDGYLWVATKGGLQRFNGKEFETVPLGRYPGLKSRAVRAMCLDRSGKLWVSMERGPVLYLSARDGKISSIESGVPNIQVRRILEDGKGAIWMIAPNNIISISGDRLTTMEWEKGEPEIFDPSAASDGQGNIWLAGRERIGMIRNGRFESRPLPGGENLLLGDSRAGGPWLVAGSRLMKLQAEISGEPEEVRQLPDGLLAEILFEDHEGVLWIGTKHSGLWRLAKGVMEKIPTSDLSIESLCEDREGNLWVGTSGGGLNLVRRRIAEMLTPPVRLPFAAVTSVCQDSDGHLWVVGSNGEVAREKSGSWETMTNFHAQATCVTAGPGGEVWVGTESQGVWQPQNGVWQRLNKKGDLPSSQVRSVMHGANGDVWITTDRPFRLTRLRDGVFVTLDGPMLLGAIRALAETPDGQVWAGTANGEILRVEGDHMVTVVASNAARPLLSVRSLLATEDGSLWIAFAGDGIGWLKNGDFRLITTAHGLRDNYISQLVADRHGGMWISANRGLFRAELWELLNVAQGKSERLRCREYGRSEALPSLQPSRNNSPSTCLLDDGRVCFAMTNGLLMVRPENARHNPLPPPVVIEEVDINEQTTARYGGEVFQKNTEEQVLPSSVGKDLAFDVPPTHEQLSFRFAALSYSSPENVQFRYRLEGFENEWNWTQDEVRVKYPRLPAGDYEFQVSASNSDGVWSDPGARVRLRVWPHFWETWWFKIGGGVATVIVTAGVVFLAGRRRYRRKLRELWERQAVEQERARIARDIHDDLGSSLTRISLLSRPGGDFSNEEPPEQEKLGRIFEISQQLMRAMGEVIWAVTPRNDSLDALANYLSDYAREFLALAGIRCRLDVPLELPDRQLSAKVRHSVFLAFKESLNNVIKHSGAHEVRIRFTPRPDGFELWVEDDGRGIPESSASGHGLGNMQDRMDEIGGTCEVSQGPEGGGRIIFKAPLQPMPHSAAAVHKIPRPRGHS